jgi:hypothetical protein
MFEDSKGEIKNVNRRRTNNTMVKNDKLGERTRVLWNGEQLLPHYGFWKFLGDFFFNLACSCSVRAPSAKLNAHLVIYLSL